MPKEFLKKYFSEITDILEDIDTDEFELFIVELKRVLKRSASIFVCGNGGSASTASHLACDINKGVSSKDKKRFKVICLNDNVPTMLAYANDMTYNDIFSEQLKNFLKKGDLVIGISASGNSENVLRAVRYANRRGVRTFGLCGFGGGRLKDAASKSIVVNSADMQKVEDGHAVNLPFLISQL